MAVSKIGKAIGFPEIPESFEDEGDEMESEAEPKAGGNTAEVLAMKQFDRATTPEARAQALKDFLEACGVY